MSEPLQASGKPSPSLFNGLLFAAIMAGMFVGLRLLNRIVWCKCGGWSPWSWYIWSSHNSQHLIDPYFFSHVLHGFIFYGALHFVWSSSHTAWRFHLAMLIEAGWELLENSPIIIEKYRENTIAQDYLGDSIANSTFDMLACALGFYLAFRLKPIYSAICIIATELMMTVLIRDCLFLNVLMLVWPIKSIGEWQAVR
jgi:hypothetical protein